MARLWLVQGDSMLPSFRAGELLWVSAGAYRSAPPSRGDVVVVHDPRGSDERYLKRVVGLPGEEALFADGMLFIDGVHLRESYLAGLPAAVGLDVRSWTLPEGEYFLLSDNRAHGTDSRHFGPVRAELVVGRVCYRVWPLSRWGRADRSHTPLR